MSDCQQVTKPRLRKQFWRDFGRVVRQARQCAVNKMPSIFVVDELNELVSYYDLESVVQIGVPEVDDLPGQTDLFVDDRKAVGSDVRQ